MCIDKGQKHVFTGGGDNSVRVWSLEEKEATKEENSKSLDLQVKEKFQAFSLFEISSYAFFASPYSNKKILLKDQQILINNNKQHYLHFTNTRA